MTWRYDDVAAGLAEYADPSLQFDLTVHTVDDRQYVALAIAEFDDGPVLCKKTFNDSRTKQETLRAGACYVRSRRKPETSEIPTQTEMRELLDLAIDKGVRRFVERARRVGLDIVRPSPTDDEQFDAQLRELGDEP